MAITVGDMVISAGVFQRPAGGAADLSKGTLVPDGVNVGIYTGSTPNYTSWATGRVDGGSYGTNNLRKVTPYSGPDLAGKEVIIPGTGPAFIGVVIQQFNTELDDTDGDGTQVPVCVVRASGFTYIAEPASLEEV